MKSQVLKPLAEPVATVPRREAFEGGQTSGLKAGKKQPIVPKPAASGSRTVETQPIVPEPAGNGEKPSFEAPSRASGNRTPPGSVWGRPNVRIESR